MKDRHDLSSSANTKITFVDGTATLQMIRVSKTDTGDYLCKATNEAGSEFCKSKVTIKGSNFLLCVRKIMVLSFLVILSFFLLILYSLDLLFYLLYPNLS